MAIVGILSSITITQYRDYKRRAYDERARADNICMVAAEEAYLTHAKWYLSSSGSSCTKLQVIGITLSLQAEDNGFLAQASSLQGSGRTFRWDSDRGVMK